MFQTYEITSLIALQGINNMKSDSKGPLENTRQQEAAHFKERDLGKTEIVLLEHEWAALKN